YRQRSDSQLVADVAGRAAPAARWPGGVLVVAERERPRPGDGDAAAADVRAVGRPRHRLLRGLPDGRALVPPHAGHAAAARDLSDRIIPAAIIPMYTPDEAIEEIEFAVRQLGYKVIMVGGLMRRPVPALAEERPDAASLVEWYDVIGLDSDHDYDPVWEKC